MSTWITGTGAISCVGRGSEALWQNALTGQSGLKNGLGYVPDSALPGESQHDSRSLTLALLAIAEAMLMAGWTALEPDDGLIIATTTGQIPLWNGVLRQYLAGEATRQQFLNAFQHQPLGDLLSQLVSHLNFAGPRLLITSACSASTQALAMASLWLQQEKVKRCLVGGIEVLCDLTISGFRSLQLLSEQAAKPFDQSRQGINLGEGSGFLCLESQASARALARLSGSGLTSDGFHMTAPHPEGQGCYEAMRLALQDAQLRPEDIDWVHAHGTGSPHNDAAEGAAIQALFPHQPWVSSTKFIHGHTLGAAGAIEAILCVQALQKQTVLKTFGLSTPDARMALHHPEQNLQTPLKHVLKNTLGFGGTNAALILSQVEGAT